MEKEGQEPYDFAHTWDTKQKATNKHNKKLTRHREQHGRYQRPWGEVGKGKGGQDQIHGGGGRRNFGR